MRNSVTGLCSVNQFNQVDNRKGSVRLPHPKTKKKKRWNMRTLCVLLKNHIAFNLWPPSTLTCSLRIWAVWLSTTPGRVIFAWTVTEFESPDCNPRIRLFLYPDTCLWNVLRESSKTGQNIRTRNLKGCVNIVGWRRERKWSLLHLCDVLVNANWPWPVLIKTVLHTFQSKYFFFQ